MEVLALVLFVLFALLGAYLNSPTVKGARGESRVNAQLERRLPAEEYKVFHDVILDSPQGPTQIDHIALSRFGVFVIETKNYEGWIFGDAKSRQWTQTIYGNKSRFKNPLRQNFKHLKAVEFSSRSIFDLSTPLSCSSEIASSRQIFRRMSLTCAVYVRTSAQNAIYY